MKTILQYVKGLLRKRPVRKTKLFVLPRYDDRVQYFQSRLGPEWMCINIGSGNLYGRGFDLIIAPDAQAYPKDSKEYEWLMILRTRMLPSSLYLKIPRAL